MNRKLAAELITQALASGSPDEADSILCAIGFDQMQELLDWRGREIASLTDVVIRLGRERDAARALADQLADMLRKDDDAMAAARAFIEEHGPFVANGVEVSDALNERLYTAREFIAAYEAREAPSQLKPQRLTCDSCGLQTEGRQAMDAHRREWGHDSPHA